jgi:hypothetical protein
LVFFFLRWGNCRLNLYLPEIEIPMKHLTWFFACVIGMLSLQSCREDEKPPQPSASSAAVTFDARWDGAPFQMQQVYVDAFGNRIRADKFMNYISLITLVAEDGTQVPIHDYLLIDFANTNQVTAEIPAGTYTALKFGIGVPRDKNKDQDPAQYASSSPLSVAGSQGMFWVWNTGYIFAKFEGKADTTGTEGVELLTPIAIHTGDDSSYREYVSQPFSIEISGTSKTFAVHLNVNQLFSPVNGNNVDIAQQAITHTSTNPELATNFMDNYLAALSLEP